MAKVDFFDVEKRVVEKLEIIKKKDPEIHAFIDVFEDEALEMANRVNEKIREGKAGKLAGYVIAIKNNIAIKGKRLTCSSRMLENYIAPYNATVIEKILAEDGIIIGTTNMDEFAAGSDTTHSAFFSTKNPRDTSLVPGGSSGGSAAAVAAGMCDAALGTDTGGSIRCPAAFCGVVGFKPTYGCVSRYGLVDMAMSLDQIGPIAKDVETASILYDVIKGKDRKDPTTTVYKEKKQEIKRIGIPTEFFEGVDERIKKIVNVKIRELEKRGFELIEVSLPSMKYVIPIYYLLMSAEFSSAMQKYDGLKYGSPTDRSEELYRSYEKVRGRNFGWEVKRRIILGTYITMKEYKDAWYTKTLRARKLLQNEFIQTFKKVDILIGPAMPTFPWHFGEKINPLEMYTADILTVSANLVGIPAGVIPLGEELAALQVQGPHFIDRSILDFLLTLSKNKS